MEPGDCPLVSTCWQVFLEIVVPYHHPICESLPFWKEYIVPVSNNVLPFMAIDILSLWHGLVTIAQCLKILACHFMADIMFNSVFLLDICSVEEIHQVLCSPFISKGQKVNADFVHNIFIDQERLVPISKRVNRKDLPGSEEGMIQLAELLNAVLPLTHPNRCLVCRGTPLIAGKRFRIREHV